MPPIPVHIDDPITPTKPQGATEKTAQQPGVPAAVQPATTTQNGSPAYPPARPGAAAVPGPTPYIPRPQPEPTRTQATGVAQGVPPPPKPGAVPLPLSQQAQPRSTLPPPPKAGETLKQQQQPPMPVQMQMSPPEQNQAYTRSTAAYWPPTSTGQQHGGLTTLNLGPVSREPQSDHPPGYHQNTYAQDMTPAQRASLDQQQRREGFIPNLGGAGGGGEGASETAGSMWNTVKGWATVAGEKLAETEESVWKAINGR